MLVTPNTTDTLQPMDISINKHYLKRRFEQWYSDEVMKQLTGEADIESIEIEPIDLRLAAVKEMTAKWLVDMANTFQTTPILLSVGFCIPESQEPSMDSVQSLRHIMNCLGVKSYQMMMNLRMRQTSGVSD